MKYFITFFLLLSLVLGVLVVLGHQPWDLFKPKGRNKQITYCKTLERLVNISRSLSVHYQKYNKYPYHLSALSVNKYDLIDPYTNSAFRYKRIMNGRACIVISAGRDRAYQIPLNQFMNKNVGVSPLRWKPPVAVFIDKQHGRRQNVNSGDFYIQLIDNTYIINDIGIHIKDIETYSAENPYTSDLSDQTPQEKSEGASTDLKNETSSTTPAPDDQPAEQK